MVRFGIKLNARGAHLIQQIEQVSLQIAGEIDGEGAILVLEYAIGRANAVVGLHEQAICLLYTSRCV